MDCKITKTREIPQAFAVSFLTAPAWPYNGPAKDGVRPLAVIAANDDNGAWGWVSLGQKEKNMIGEAMLEVGVNAEEWWWCELYYADGEQPCKHMTCDIADKCTGPYSLITDGCW